MRCTSVLMDSSDFMVTVGLINDVDFNCMQPLGSYGWSTGFCSSGCIHGFPYDGDGNLHNCLASVIPNDVIGIGFHPFTGDIIATLNSFVVAKWNINPQSMEELRSSCHTDVQHSSHLAKVSCPLLAGKKERILNEIDVPKADELLEERWYPAISSASKVAVVSEICWPDYDQLVPRSVFEALHPVLDRKRPVHKQRSGYWMCRLETCETSSQCTTTAYPAFDILLHITDEGHVISKNLEAHDSHSVTGSISADCSAVLQMKIHNEDFTFSGTYMEMESRTQIHGTLACSRIAPLSFELSRLFVWNPCVRSCDSSASEVMQQLVQQSSSKSLKTNISSEESNCHILHTRTAK
eukprot:ANDGO_06850.mRNA.1 hypothetical protein